MKPSSRQICFFLAAVAPVGKLVLMPAQLAAGAGNDLLFPVLAQLVLQAALIFGVLLLARRDCTVFALVRRAAGDVAARIFAVLLAAFLLFFAFLPVVEQKITVRSIFYDTIPAHLVFAPFFLFSAYLSARALGSLGRVWDILAPLSAVGMAGVLLLSVGNADFGALAPFGAAGTGGFVDGIRRTCCWFCDSALLLAMIGHFPYQKGLAWKGTLCYLGGGLVLLFFLAVFYGVFGEIAVLQTPAFARVSAFFSAATVLGRIDYLFIFALAFVMTFYVVLPVQEAVGTLAEAFGGASLLPTLLSVGCNTLLFAAVSLLDLSSSQTISAITGTLFWIFPLFSAALPLVLLALFGRRQREKIS